MTSNDPAGRCMADGCLCCYDACDCNRPLCCCMGAEDCLCIRHSCCVAFNSRPLGCGCTTDKDRGEICKIGCFCCDCGLVYPTKLCACAGQTCCCYSSASLPCSKEYVAEPVCAYCYLQCLPRVGCCIPPPDCPALNKMKAGEPLNPPQQQAMDGRPPAGAAPDQTAPPPGTTTVTETVKADGSKEVTKTVVNNDGSRSVTVEKVQPLASAVTH